MAKRPATLRVKRRYIVDKKDRTDVVLSVSEYKRLTNRIKQLEVENDKLVAKNAKLAAENAVCESLKKTFTCNHKGASAQGRCFGPFFLVLKGSTASCRSALGTKPGYRRLRDELIDNKILVQEDGYYHFTEDYLFDSPSAAACIVANNPRSGPGEWRRYGQTLGQFLDEVKQRIMYKST